MYPGETQEFCLERLDSRSEPDEDISRFFFETNVFAIDELLYNNNNIPPHVSVTCDEAINAATDSSSKQVAEDKNSESNPADGYTNSTMENRSSIKPPHGSTTASTESASKQHAVAKPVKDMVVLRSRRGQATNKHSIAERVRRENIKKRMNCLQDLVPGCHKGAAKTIILDQIINYIKSLQYQIEFLSMKLSAASTRYSFCLEPGQGNDDLRSTLVCKPASLFQP